jgi:hypothetical protein
VAADLSSDDDTWKKLEKETQARELFKAGESASKSGNIESAALYWLKTLEVKPESAYTKQCLAKIQKQLLATYGGYASKLLANQDRVSAYLTLKSLCSYIPGDASLTAKADAIKGKMTGNETKAVKSYDDAAYYYQWRSFEKAREHILSSKGFAANSETVKMAAATIQKAFDANPPKKAEPKPEPGPNEQQVAVPDPAPTQEKRGPTIHWTPQNQPVMMSQPLFTPRTAPSWQMAQRSSPQMSVKRNVSTSSVRCVGST